MPTAAANPFVVDNVEDATRAIEDLCNTHDGVLALDVEGKKLPADWGGFGISLGVTISGFFLIRV
jgi:hypothetical protein